MSSGKKAVFLDRDGTINIDTGYIDTPERFEFIPGSLTAIRRLKQAGFLIVVITNQAGIAKGIIRQENVAVLNEAFIEMLKAAGARCDGYYFCPHHPEGVIEKYRQTCSCRKPEPGLILRAVASFGIDLRQSFMVGDKLSDLLAARHAGIRSLLVMTGYGRTELERSPQVCGAAASVAVYDLYDAASWILKSADAPWDDADKT